MLNALLLRKLHHQDLSVQLAAPFFPAETHGLLGVGLPANFAFVHVHDLPDTFLEKAEDDSHPPCAMIDGG